MDRINLDVLEAVIDHIVDEETLGVCFEIHRAIKLQYYDVVNPDESSIERHDIVDEPGRDVFGNNLQSLRKTVECVCPSCQRTLGASKFAPHLEKCLGMGRTSSRLAAHNKRPITTRVESEGEHSDDNEDEWTYPEKKGGIGPKVSKKIKKDRFVLANPPSRKPTAKPVKETLPPSNGISSTSDGFYGLKPSLQQHNAASFSSLPTDYKQQLLQQICGVISERTGKLCTRTMKCPQHSEDDRKDVRRKLLESHKPVDVTTSHSLFRTTIHDDMEYEGHFTHDKEESLEKSHKQKYHGGDNKKHKRSHHQTTAGY